MSLLPVPSCVFIRIPYVYLVFICVCIYCLFLPWCVVVMCLYGYVINWYICVFLDCLYLCIYYLYSSMYVFIIYFHPCVYLFSVSIFEPFFLFFFFLILGLVTYLPIGIHSPGQNSFRVTWAGGCLNSGCIIWMFRRESGIGNWESGQLSLGP